MNKFLMSITALAMSFAFLSAEPSQQAISAMCSSDLAAADAQRMSLEKSGDVETLLAAIGKIENKKIRDGAIYSLACLKAKQAYPIIRQMAFDEKDACPAAVLGLQKFGTPEALADLDKLAKGGSSVAESALFMAGKNGNVAKRGFVAGRKNFALSKAVELSQKGGENSAGEILSIAKASGENPDEFALCLAMCARSDSAICAGVENCSIVAVKAARIRLCSEAEEPLLKIAASSYDEALKKEAFFALESVGANRSIEKFAGGFSKISKSEMPAAVKILRRAFTRVDAQFAGEWRVKLRGENFDEDFRKAAAEKILSE